MSERSKVISRLLDNRSTREAYIGAKLRVLIPSQIRALRLKSQTSRQEDLANAAEMKQSRISAMETPGAVNFNLETLVRLSAALKVALQVRFVSYSEMLEWENSFSQDEFNVRTIDSDADFLGTSGEPSITEDSGQAVVAELLDGFFKRPNHSGGEEVKNRSYFKTPSLYSAAVSSRGNEVGFEIGSSQNPQGGENLYETVSRNTGQSPRVYRDL